MEVFDLRTNVVNDNAAFVSSFVVIRDPAITDAILDCSDAMQRAIDSREPYQTVLDPPPGSPRVAHDEGTRPEWAVR